MKIKGDLDLSKARIESFLNAEKCAFFGSILLQYVEVREVHFSGCHVNRPKGDRKESKALDAEGARILGSFHFNDDSRAQGEVSLLGVTVGGDLDCSGSHFSNSGGDALSADGVKVDGDVLLGKCEVKGAIRFLGATIGGNFDCSAAQFQTQDGGINGDGMRISGDVLLVEGFHSEGLVRFSETRITGNFDCTGSKFSGSAESLGMEEAEIDGNVLFNDFTAGGEVNLMGATIGGDFECRRAQFFNPEDALTADALRVVGDVTFGEGFKAHGEVRLFRATIGGDFACEGAQFIHQGDALSLDGAKIAGDAKFSGGITANGRIRFPGATIGGNLDCQGTRLLRGEAEGAPEVDKEGAFNAEGAQIEGTVFFGDQFVADGEVSFIGASIAGDLTFGHAKFNSPTGDAIAAHRARIRGDVIFGESFEARGGVRFLGAIIGGDLECEDAQFSNLGKDALSAESAKIEGSVTLHKRLNLRGALNLENAEVHHRLDLCGFSIPAETTINLLSATVGVVHGDEANWESKGKLLLDGFTYERFHVGDPIKAEKWIKWLRQQLRAQSVPQPDEQQLRAQSVPQPYEQLATVLRKMGYERDAKRVMIAKNRDHARATEFPRQGWWWYKVFGRAIGYGYAPWRAFAMSVFMILLGFFLFTVGSGDLVSPTKESAFQKDANGAIAVDATGRRVISKQYPVFSPFFYSVESFTPLLKLDQSANWTPDANSNATVHLGPCFDLTGPLLRYYLYVHIASGWLLTSLWVGAVTGLVKS